MLATAVAGVWYLFTPRGREDMPRSAREARQPVVSWQHLTITEERKSMSMRMTVPRMIIPHDHRVSEEVNTAIAQHAGSLQDDFTSAVATAAEDNGEANTLHVETELLLMTPRFISLAFTTSEHLSGARDKDPERTFLVFDLIGGKRILEGNELFRDDAAWSKAVKAMKASLLAYFQGEPSCDLSFAPASQGLAASCIGVDWSRGGKHVSVNGDIPLSIMQEFLAPSVLLDII